MAVLALKLGLTPLLIAGASLAARRWGPSVGGWLVALPLTSGPVAFFVALDHGASFAADLALGSLGGLAAIAVFALAYAMTARRRPPAAAFGLGAVSFGLAGLAMQPALDASIWIVLAIVLVLLGGVVFVLPSGRGVHVRVDYPWWDIPARMIVATVLVIGLTTIAPLLGPHVSGVISTFPVYLSVLTVFAHLRVGPAAAVEVLRGSLVGLFGTAAFFVVVIEALGTVGIAPAFAGAVIAAMSIQALALRSIRPPSRPEPV